MDRFESLLGLLVIAGLALVVPLIPFTIPVKPEVAWGAEFQVGVTQAAETPTKGTQEEILLHAREEISELERFVADRLSISPMLALNLPAEAVVERAPRYQLREQGLETTIAGWSESVGELAEEIGLEVGELDRLEPGRGHELAPGETIRLIRVIETELIVHEPIPYRTEYLDDPELARGEEREEKPGTSGKVAITFLVTREDGIEVRRRQIRRVVEVTPLPQVVRRGTKIVLLAEGTATWYRGVGAMTAAHRTLPKGKRVEVEHLGSGKKIVVKIADRGPFTRDILDLSRDAFEALAPLGAGRIRVRILKLD